MTESRADNKPLRLLNNASITKGMVGASKNLITRLVVAALAFQFLLISAGSFVALNYGKDWLRKDFAEKTQIMTDTLGQLVSPFLCENKIPELIENLEIHLTHGEIEFIKVYQNNSVVVSLGETSDSISQNPIEQNLAEIFEQSKIYTTYASVSPCEKSNVEAEIEVGFNFSRLLEPLALAKNIILIGSIIEFLAIIGVFLLSRRLVALKLLAIEEKCKKVALGEFDSVFHLSGGDEFARIAKSINDMSQSLKDLNAQTDAARIKLLSQAKLSSIGEMAAGIAHEVNNPLAIVSGRIDLAINQLKKSPPNIEKALETLDKTFNAVHRAAQIIKGLKLLSRNSEGDPLVDAALEEVIKDALSLTTEKIRAQGIDLQVHLSSGILIQCRPGQISQVVINLIHNSADAIENLSEKWIRIESSVVNGKARVTVTDSGSGIPEAILQKLMEPFFTTKPVGIGTGLGLSVSRGILEGHGGVLEYDRKSPNTSFFLEIPLAQNQNQPKVA